MKIVFKISLLTSFVYLVGCSGGNTDDTSNQNSENTPTQTQQSSGDPTPQDIITDEPQGDGDGPLNPPHGEPGHVCEIPVGAPLNSQPENQSPMGQTQSAPGQGTPGQAVPEQTAPGEGTVAKGLNPPHGEPGHDCNIPVGAPLNE